MTKLSDWKWCIDYSKTVGQKDTKIAPFIFSSRDNAQKANKKMFPKGRIVKVEIKIKK